MKKICQILAFPKFGLFFLDISGDHGSFAALDRGVLYQREWFEFLNFNTNFKITKKFRTIFHVSYFLCKLFSLTDKKLKTSKCELIKSILRKRFGKPARKVAANLQFATRFN